jgi:hypothetical protein
MWVHKATFIPSRPNTTTPRARRSARPKPSKSRRSRASHRHQVGDERPAHGSTTTITYSKVEYNVDLTEDVFTERYLRNPPARNCAEA